MALTAVGKKRRTPEERREEIIKAAVSLFARQGFERTTTREIAAAAGISEGTIYKYFASKQEILFAFVQPTIFSSLPDLFQRYANMDDREILRAFIADRLSLWEQNQDLMRAVFGEAMFNPALADGMNRMIQPALQVIEAFFAQRMREGAFRHIDPAVAARALIGHLLAYFLKWILLGDTESLRIPHHQLVDELTDLFLHGIQSPSYSREEAPSCNDYV